MLRSRRNFLKFSAALAAGKFFSPAFASAIEQRLPLAFSTLGCPAWEWPKILQFAETAGFLAIELRGLLGDLDLPARPEFSPERLAQSKGEIAARGLRIACVSSSSELHEADPARRAKSIADARRFVDLAAALAAPNVRIFGNQIRGSKADVVARVAAGMRELAEYAGPRGVTILLESHGDFTDSPTLKEVLVRADSPSAALLWDAHHTFAASHEQPDYTVRELGRWIRHTHLKDSVPDGPEAKNRRYVLTGKGDVPVEGAINALRHISYTGLYCFEWEKLWHPDLEGPEIAFPDFLRTVSAYLRAPLP
jgi:sugar phosphate isomerase/epimerase